MGGEETTGRGGEIIGGGEPTGKQEGRPPAPSQFMQEIGFSGLATSILAPTLVYFTPRALVSLRQKRFQAIAIVPRESSFGRGRGGGEA